MGAEDLHSLAVSVEPRMVYNRLQETYKSQPPQRRFHPQQTAKNGCDKSLQVSFITMV